MPTANSYVPPTEPFSGKPVSNTAPITPGVETSTNPIVTGPIDPVEGTIPVTPGVETSTTPPPLHLLYLILPT